MRDKISVLFIPAVILMVALVGGYSLIHWILIITLEDLPLKSMWIEFIIPFGLGLICVWVLIRHRLRFLKFDRTKKNPDDFYCVILWIAIAVPTIIAQLYITSASGKLAALENMGDVEQHPARYYTVKNFYIDKSHIGVFSTFEASGKYNEHFDMTIYIAVPMMAKAADTIQRKSAAWLCLDFRKQISNRLTPAEKEAKYQEMLNDSERKFDARDLSAFNYLERPPNSDKRDGYTEAVRKCKVYGFNKQILVSHTEDFSERSGDKLKWIFLSALIGLSVWMIMIAIPAVDEDARMGKAISRPDDSSTWQDIIAMLKPRDGYAATPLLIQLNVLIFVVMVIVGLGFIRIPAQELLNWGANYGPYTREGQPWRLLTNIFLHGGVMHVLLNMVGLFFVGIFLEPILNSWKFLTVYIVAGLLASLASIWWYPDTVSVGASGAIFGLYGVFLAALILKVYPPDFRKAFLWSAVIYIGYNLLFGLVGGIDNAAHIGGLVSGLVMGVILSNSMRRQIETNMEEEGRKMIEETSDSNVNSPRL